MIFLCRVTASDGAYFDPKTEEYLGIIEAESEVDAEKAVRELDYNFHKDRGATVEVVPCGKMMRIK
jgi:preprotein translocase subunit Sec63